MLQVRFFFLPNHLWCCKEVAFVFLWYLIDSIKDSERIQDMKIHLYLIEKTEELLWVFYARYGMAGITFWRFVNKLFIP